MKSVLALAVAGLAAFTSAQGLNNFPPCALTCLTSGLSDTKCSVTDFKCACSNQQFVTTSSECILKSCDTSSQQKALDAAKGLCKSAGITITPPVASPGASSTSTATTTSTTAASTATPSSSGTGTTYSGNSTNSTISSSQPVQTHPESSSGRLSAALSLVGLGVMAALAF